MESTKIRIPAENQSRIVMPAYAATTGVVACAWADVPVRKHVLGADTFGTTGTPVWSPPTC